MAGKRRAWRLRQLSDDASGNFQFAGVAPGDYYALAVREFSPFDFLISQLGGTTKLKPAEAKAPRVRVEDGAARIRSVAADA